MLEIWTEQDIRIVSEGLKVWICYLYFSITVVKILWEIWNLWTDSVLVLLFHHLKNIVEAQMIKTLPTSSANLFCITKNGSVPRRQKVSLAAISRDWWIRDLLYPSHAHKISQGTKFKNLSNAFFYLMFTVGRKSNWNKYDSENS